MKNSTVLVVTVAAIVSLSTGCRNPNPKVTILPGSSATADASRRDQGLNTNPLGAGAGVNGGAEPTSVAVVDPTIPDSSKLFGRDEDRAAFRQQTLYFEYDRATVRADEASKIDQVAAEFKTKGADFDLLVEGHCDERGTEEYNRSLGERRALAIRDLLIKSGVDSAHVFTKTLGKDQPANSEHNETAWAKNRRGEFVLVLPKKITTTQNTQ
jgi:peptidoglycan-associated lipoprotein